MLSVGPELVTQQYDYGNLQKHICMYCDVQKEDRLALRQHEAMHNIMPDVVQKGPFLCTQCGSRFLRREDLEEHRLTAPRKKCRNADSNAET